MSKVYLTQEALRRDRNTGTLVPAFDISPATAYGEIETLMPYGQVSLAPAVMYQELRRKLKDFSDDDYLLPAGDPAVMMAAAMAAASVNNGRVNILRWEGRTRQYIKLTIGPTK